MSTFRSAPRTMCGIGLLSMMAVSAWSCAPTKQDEDLLTEPERNAAGAAVQSTSALAQTAGATSVVSTSQPPTAKPALATSGVAGCPVLTISPAEGTATFNVSLDFDGGCPLPDQTEPVCSGSTSGQIDFSTQHVNLTFQALSCDSAPSLDGTVDLNYSVADSSITLDGTWDLTFTTAEDQSRITGPGTVIFDTAAQVVTISQFEGQLTRGADTSNITVDSVVISLADNPSLTPSAGTIRLDGGLLRQFTIRFNENSPSTRVVEVSIFGLIFVPIDLDTFDL